MKRDNRCIVCGKSVGKDGSIGTIKGMSVSFCSRHADFCESCEALT
jgi:hypothetical protein